MTDNQRDWAEEKAAKISLEIPGNWPDTKSQKARIEYIAAALREAMERQKREDIEIIRNSVTLSAGGDILECTMNPVQLMKAIFSQRDDTKERT
jgi:hypothetical protein